MNGMKIPPPPPPPPSEKQSVHCEMTQKIEIALVIYVDVITWV